MLLTTILMTAAVGAEVSQKYGWPIGNWCVGDIEDFSGLFAATSYFTKS